MVRHVMLMMLMLMLVMILMMMMMMMMLMMVMMIRTCLKIVCALQMAILSGMIHQWILDDFGAFPQMFRQKPYYSISPWNRWFCTIFLWIWKHHCSSTNLTWEGNVQSPMSIKYHITWFCYYPHMYIYIDTYYVYMFIYVYNINISMLICV